MNTERYTRKPFEVEAKQVTADNFHEIAEWCKGEVKQTSGDDAFSSKGRRRTYVKVYVISPRHVRQTMAFEGDWVVYSGTGFKIYRDKAFADTFDRSEDYSPEVKHSAEEAAKKLPSMLAAVQDVVRSALVKQDSATYHARPQDTVELAKKTSVEILDLLMRGGSLRQLEGRLLEQKKGLTLPAEASPRSRAKQGLQASAILVDEMLNRGAVETDAGVFDEMNRTMPQRESLKRLAVETDAGVIHPFENR